MAEIDVKAIRARADAATPGPWFHRQAGKCSPRNGEPWDWIADSLVNVGHKIIVGRQSVYGGSPDYAFIANARTDIPALCDAYEAQAKEIKRLKGLLREARRAIGDHNAPNDCYATGPLTGDPFRDLVQCPACSFIAMYDEHLSTKLAKELGND